MRKFFTIVITILLISSCTKDEVNESKATSVPNFMFELYDNNSSCSDVDYLNLNINGNKSRVIYNSSSINLCGFTDVHKVYFNQIQEVHYATLVSLGEVSEYFEELPIYIGMDYDFGDNENVPLTEIKFKGLKIIISLPNAFENNLKVGSYHHKDTPYSVDYGFDFSFFWEVTHESADFFRETGYTLRLDKGQAYKISLNCIDSIDDDTKRISGSFEGIFVGRKFQEYEEVEPVYQLPVEGDFSYEINY